MAEFPAFITNSCHIMGLVNSGMGFVIIRSVVFFVERYLNVTGKLNVQSIKVFLF